MSLLNSAKIFFLIFIFKIVLCEKNNACKHLYLYPFMNFVPKPHCFYNPNVNSTMHELVTNNGYDLKPYNVTTSEGYILTIFRILKKGSDKSDGQPVYIQHGLATDSRIWAFTGNRSLAFNVVDEGYDVWLGNIRSSIYAKTNINYATKSKSYWDFNVDNLANDDLASGLKLVANVTGKAGKIIYLGHSLGTTMIFIYASQFCEEAQSLLKGIVALSPIVHFGPNIYWRTIFQLGPVFNVIAKVFNIYVLFENPIPFRNFLIKVLNKIIPYYVGSMFIDMFSGKTDLFLPEDVSSLESYYLDSLGTQSIMHYIQIERAHKFQKYDYGSEKNKKLYGQKHPPLYDLSKIKMPTYLFYGENDAFFKPKNVYQVYEELGSADKDIQKVPIGRDESNLQFGHNDFATAKDIQTLFYSDLFRYLKKLN